MTDYSPRLKVQYKDKITNALMEEFSYKNRMQLPKLDKIVLNIGCGREAVLVVVIQLLLGVNQLKEPEHEIKTKRHRS